MTTVNNYDLKAMADNITQLDLSLRAIEREVESQAISLDTINSQLQQVSDTVDASITLPNTKEVDKVELGATVQMHTSAFVAYPSSSNYIRLQNVMKEYQSAMAEST